MQSIASGCSQMNRNYKDLDTSQYHSVFGENVLVFDEAMDLDSIKLTLEALHEQQKHSEFGSERTHYYLNPVLII